MLEFARTLTLEPASVRRSHIAELQRHGFDDAAITHAVQVIALFNYYNRIADGLGITLDDDPPAATAAS